MLSPFTADLASQDLGNGSVVEYTKDLLEELRRLSVAGFVAFGRGGLEIGGVLYGSRNGSRLTIHSFVEFASEHARGPGFLLSEKDRQAFAQLVKAPAGMETLGWYRAHNRSDLRADAGDRELFDQFPTGGSTLGLVLKPSHWGPSAAAFYLREADGAIVPESPREFAVTPPARPAQASHHPEEPPPPACEPESPVAATEVKAPVKAPVELAIQALAPWSPPPRNRWPLAIGAAILVAAIGLALYLRSRHPRDLNLQAYAITEGQLRISWDHGSLPAIEGVSGVVEIRDGVDDTKIPLTANQLRLSSITYAQKTSHVEVSLRVDGARAGSSPLQESIEFVGPAQPGVQTVAAEIPPEVAAPRQVEADRRVRLGSTPELSPTWPTHRAREEEPVEVAEAVSAHIRPFQPPPSHTAPAATAPAPAILPAAPSAVPVTLPQQPVLPYALEKAPIVPRPAVIPPAKAEPRSGRLIWTGKLRRHEIVEIAGGWASVGSLSGSLSGVAADFRILPAEFTRDGLSIYTPDGKIHGRTEPPSVSNGWNPVTFEFDPVKVKELVVLEAPNRLNSFKRLVMRCDSRICPVVVVDWTTR